MRLNVAPPEHSCELTCVGQNRLADELRTRLQRTRLLCLDVDGVLSDGHLYFGESGAFWQRFCVQDGVGIQLLQKSGVEVAILSAGEVRSAKVRAEQLGVRHAYFGLTDKVAKFDALAAEQGVTAAEAAFVGDEVSDLPLLHHVGFSASVPDAVDEVRAAVHYVTRRRGGDGAVREICDLIRRARGHG